MKGGGHPDPSPPPHTHTPESRENQLKCFIVLPSLVPPGSIPTDSRITFTLTTVPTPPTSPLSQLVLLPDSILHSLSPALFVLLALAIYTGVTVSFLGRRFGDWRFSWSYILGWVALLMTFFAGTEAGEWEG